MKVEENFSICALFMAIVLIIIKLVADYQVYLHIKEIMHQGDIQPSFSIDLVFLLPIFISLILSVIGFKLNNRYRKLALAINLFGLMYLLIPIGIFLFLVLK